MFSYNYKSGNIIIHDKYVLRYDNDNGTVRFWYKYKNCKMYLCNTELQAANFTLSLSLQKKHGHTGGFPFSGL